MVFVSIICIFWGKSGFFERFTEIVYIGNICFYLLGWIYWFHFAVDYFGFYSIFAISITLLLYNNGPDFPGSNNRTMFSLLTWYWLTIRRDFPIDKRINIESFPKGHHSA